MQWEKVCRLDSVAHAWGGGGGRGGTQQCKPLSVWVGKKTKGRIPNEEDRKKKKDKIESKQ